MCWPVGHKCSVTVWDMFCSIIYLKKYEFKFYAQPKNLTSKAKMLQKGDKSVVCTVTTEVTSVASPPFL